MILTLLAVSLNDQELTRPISAHFDANGGTIGRADHSTMALPDPERVISRKQAEVVFAGDGFLIRNTGAANPIQVSGRDLGQGETALLRGGEEIRVGGYLLRAKVGAGPAAHAEFEKLASPLRTTPLPAERERLPVTTPPALGNDNPFADLLEPAPSGVLPGDPFADLLGTAPGSAPAADPFAGLAGASTPEATAGSDPFSGMMAGPAGLAERSGALAAGPAAPAARLPDDFDPFAAPAAAAPTPGATSPAFAAPSATDPLADFSPPGASLDEAFGLAAAPGGDDALSRFSADLGGGAPVAGSESLPTDPLLLFGDPASAPAAPAPAQRDDAPALHAAFTPPRAQAPIPTVVMAPAPAPKPARPPAVSTPPRAAAAPVAADDAEVLWQAFCEGAGIAVPLPAGSGPERMRTIGRVLRSAVDGTLQLMAVRASTKHEMRAAMTQIMPVSNNPLKFAPDAGIGVEQLVQPPTRGFLEGPAAMDDAMQDLVGHSIGTVTGMRAAIDGMLDRFDPAALEKKLTSGSVLDSLLPMNRRSRLWELYLQHHKAIREEAQEDFHTLFGKAFLAAYEQQVERLKNRGSK